MYDATVAPSWVTVARARGTLTGSTAVQSLGCTASLSYTCLKLVRPRAVVVSTYWIPIDPRRVSGGGLRCGSHLLTLGSPGRQYVRRLRQAGDVRLRLAPELLYDSLLPLLERWWTALRSPPTLFMYSRHECLLADLAQGGL